MHHLPPDKIAEEQEYQGSHDIWEENIFEKIIFPSHTFKYGSSTGTPSAFLGIDYYFDTFVQRPINRHQK